MGVSFLRSNSRPCRSEGYGFAPVRLGGRAYSFTAARELGRRELLLVVLLVGGGQGRNVVAAGDGLDGYGTDSNKYVEPSRGVWGSLIPAVTLESCRLVSWGNGGGAGALDEPLLAGQTR